MVGQPQSVEVNGAKMLEDSEVHLRGKSEKRGGVWRAHHGRRSRELTSRLVDRWSNM